MLFGKQISTILISAIGVSQIAGCALSAAKSSAVQVQMPAQTVKPAPPLSREEILEKYGPNEFENAETLLRVLGKDSLYSAEGESFLGCRFDREKSEKFTAVLNRLLENEAESLRNTYVENPVAFARIKGFESCTAKCSCGLWMKVIEAADTKRLATARLRSTHQKFLKKLRIKATRQSAEESLSCAENQTWFCDSDLRSFLEENAK